ncbi:MAG: diguanylate cyclase [Chloroflexi bacterium]|nr:diguanylate cyclase [Chloroflexota bacterium]
MTFAFTPHIWPIVVSSSILMVLVMATIRHRHEVSARLFLGLLLALLIWSVSFIIEILGVELSTKIFWANIQFIGITAIPIFFLMLVARFSGHERSIRPILYALILLAVISNIIIWTDNFHHWFRGQPYIDLIAGPFPVLVNDYALWFYYILAPLSYLGHIIILVLLFRNFRGSKKTYQSQTIALFVSLLIPLVVDLLYVLGITPIPNFNFAPAAFSISGMLIAWALFRYQLFDLVPLAHSIIIENLAESMIVLDVKNRIIELNRSASAVLQIPVNQAIGQLAEDAVWFWDELDPHIEDIQPIAITKEQGGQQHYEALLTPIKRKNKATVGLVLTLRDITAQYELLQKTKQLAISDPLTGIYNRRHFFSLLQQELERARRQHSPLAVMMFDIDDFKAINDQYGHAAGDQVLIETVQLCQQHLRAYDVMSRYGGDEFAIYLPQTDLELASHVARRLCASIRAHIIQSNHHSFQRTVSIGVAACSCKQQDSADSLMAIADKALYQAKQNGKDQIATEQTPKSEVPIRPHRL